MRYNFSFYVISSALLLTGVLFFGGCKEDDTEPTQEAQLIFKFRYDETQERLDNFGQPSSVPQGNAAQSPTMNEMAAHYIELAPSRFTQLGDGESVYKTPETTAGGDTAMVFDSLTRVGNNEAFFSMPLSAVQPGTYEYLRVSLAYQNFDIEYEAFGSTFTGTVASFVGYNTYINSYMVKNETVTVNDDKLQGYWGFETVGTVETGQAAGTTVPNPIASTSPIPSGSCVVTGPFQQPLEITGEETEDITIVVSLSINNSFEWDDPDGNGTFNPVDGDVPVDMGVRGMIPLVE